MWDIYSNETIPLWSMWHRLIKSLFGLPLPTHRYLLNEIIESEHIKKTIIKRFLKFTDTLSSSTNPNLTFLHRVQSRDWRSTYGRNYMGICREANVNDIRLVDLSAITVNPVPQDEVWRINFLNDILDERDDECAALLSDEELAQVLHFVCTQ